MSYDTLQLLVIGTAVAASAIYATLILAPKAVQRTRTRLALVLLRPQRGDTLRTLGRWLAPGAATVAACGSCNSCAPAK